MDDESIKNLVSECLALAKTEADRFFIETMNENLAYETKSEYDIKLHSEFMIAASGRLVLIKTFTTYFISCLMIWQQQQKGMNYVSSFCKIQCCSVVNPPARVVTN